MMFGISSLGTNKDQLLHRIQNYKQATTKSVQGILVYSPCQVFSYWGNATAQPAPSKKCSFQKWTKLTHKM